MGKYNSDSNIVDEWKLYDAMVKYNQSIIIGDKSYYDQIDVNIAFTKPETQWRNVEAEDISKPVIPIIPKAREHTIANVCSTNISATIQPLEYNSNEDKRTPEMEEAIEATDLANAEIRNIFDDIKYEFKVREGLGDAFDMGDMCLHWYWDTSIKPFKGKYKAIEGKLEAELIDAPNVGFGNANNPNPQIQPYIIIVGRELASVLQEEAKLYKENKEGKDIVKDTEWNYQAGDNGKVELECDKYGKALYIIVYKKDKKTGEVLATKCVKNAYIYKDVKTGLTKYPVAWMNYKKQKNQYHGSAGVSGLIPNQIAVNKLLAMIIYAVMNNAFPKLFYNAERMAAPTNKIGEAIPLKNMQMGETINNVMGYSQVGQPAEMVVKVIDLIMMYTKDMLGINDAAVGNTTPDNTSAMALAEKLSSVPLENVRSNLYEFTEQNVDIILDFISSKYGKRPVKVKDGDNTSLVAFDFNKFKDLSTSKRIDVGAIGYASELSSIKELRDLLEMGKIETIDYLERLPEYTIPRVKELVEEIKARMGYVSTQEQKNKEAEWEQMMNFFNSLPAETQAQLKSLPDNEFENAVKQLMQESMKGGQAV